MFKTKNYEKFESFKRIGLNSRSEYNIFGFTIDHYLHGRLVVPYMEIPATIVGGSIYKAIYDKLTDAQRVYLEDTGYNYAVDYSKSTPGSSELYLLSKRINITYFDSVFKDYYMLNPTNLRHFWFSEKQNNYRLRLDSDVSSVSIYENSVKVGYRKTRVYTELNETFPHTFSKWGDMEYLGVYPMSYVIFGGTKPVNSHFKRLYPLKLEKLFNKNGSPKFSLDYFNEKLRESIIKVIGVSDHLMREKPHTPVDQDKNTYFSSDTLIHAAFSALAPEDEAADEGEIGEFSKNKIE